MSTLSVGYPAYIQVNAQLTARAIVGIGDSRYVPSVEIGLSTTGNRLHRLTLTLVLAKALIEELQRSIAEAEARADSANRDR